MPAQAAFTAKRSAGVGKSAKKKRNAWWLVFRTLRREGAPFSAWRLEGRHTPLLRPKRGAAAALRCAPAGILAMTAQNRLVRL